MKKLLIISLLCLSGCATIKGFWIKEEPIVKKDVQQIEKDFVKDIESPCNQTPSN
jgi:hypothetical protein